MALDYPLTALTLQVGQQVSLYPRSLLGNGLRVVSTPFLPAGLELDEFSGHISGQALARERPKLWRFRAEAAAHGDLQGRGLATRGKLTSGSGHTGVWISWRSVAGSRGK